MTTVNSVGDTLLQLLNQVLLYVPKLISALIILIIGYIIARIVRGLVTKGLRLVHFDQVADRAERLASYLSEANGDRMLRDVERFARRQPWAFTVGGVVAGFFAARFLKASSEQRFQGGGDAMYRSGPAPAQRPALPSPAGDGLTTPGVSGVDGR